MILKNIFSPVTKQFVERRVLKGIHPMHLFRIIQDVDSYSKFLPLCWHSQVLHVYDGGRSFDATLTVGIPWGKALKEQYTSRVTVQPETMTIHSKSIQSTMFDSLKSTWKLKDASENDTTTTINNHRGCHVSFQVEMTVADPMIVGILDRVLEEVAIRQIEAFEKRCHEIPLPPELQDAQQQ
ncbi:Polyketide cyclase / dehydrase and lipid transport [Seminavis robusta]|uniref:Polyketide cyclase / dehydrase and lipid transport n=1 Tax=Seminavis robusta TaxID=568900 RepID=A0A9N8HVE9_9STRA|nr:Polyketide cyclase / dehydrase and lipid transport [Seminavis robusta]|eukprot:Sro1933_g306260.1 Polyketide cyclase / dehydrase and lipid transport (182) ;mRNA; r:11249-11794